jgi:hypothetical protein
LILTAPLFLAGSGAVLVFTLRVHFAHDFVDEKLNESLIAREYHEG